MKIDAYEALKRWPVLNGPASDDAIREAAAALRRRLPDDYVQFLREHDGGEGFVRENFLILWKAEELEACNREYEVDEYAPGLLLFGANGGGQGYGFDTREAAVPVVRVLFIGVELRYVRRVARNFGEFLSALERAS